jgi:hypothetical protein
VESAVYFSCLEALQNVAKYSGASWAVIRLATVEGDVRFEVEDGGTGFDASANQLRHGVAGHGRPTRRAWRQDRRSIGAWKRHHDYWCSPAGCNFNNPVTWANRGGLLDFPPCPRQEPTSDKESQEHLSAPAAHGDAPL